MTLLASDKVALSEADQVEKEILELKQTIIQLAAKKEEHIKNNALANFTPHAKQLQFFENADKRHRAGYCGNRFGKTTIGTVEDCCWALGERPFFPVGHPLRRLGIPVHGVKILVLSEDWDKVYELFTNNDSSDRPGKFFEYLPKDKIINTTRMQKGIINSITVRNKIDGRYRESIIVFDTVRSYINNPRSFESSDWDAIHIDEPIMEELHTAASRGLIDRAGKEWWLLTPLGFPWMYEKSKDLVAAKPEDNWMFEASMDDNPLLDQKAKEAYLLELPEEERECRQNGKPLAHGRRVYGHFNEHLHIWKDKQPPKDWVDFHTPPWTYSCGYALDPHPQTPHAVLFVAISPQNEIYLYDEIFEKLLIRDVAKKIVLKRDKVRCTYELCDPSAWIENPDTGLSWANTLYSYDLNVVKASKDKHDGIISAQQVWKDRRIHVMPHMTNFIREIKRYFFDRENKPVDKNDHMMENFYRLNAHNNFQYIPADPLLSRFKTRSKPPADEFAGIGTDLGYQETFNI